MFNSHQVPGKTRKYRLLDLLSVDLPTCFHLLSTACVCLPSPSVYSTRKYHTSVCEFGSPAWSCLEIGILGLFFRSAVVTLGRHGFSSETTPLCKHASSSERQITKHALAGKVVDARNPGRKISRADHTVSLDDEYSRYEVRGLGWSRGHRLAF